MIPLDGQINSAKISEAVSPHGGGLGIELRGNISEIKAELITQSKQKVNVGLILGVLATKKIRKKIGTSDNGKSLIGKRIEIVIE